MADALEQAPGVEDIPHYIVYNADTNVLYTYPEASSNVSCDSLTYATHNGTLVITSRKSF